MDIVERLEVIGNLKKGDPPPEWLPYNGWAGPISALCQEAAEEIKYLRLQAGAVTRGPSFPEIRAMKHDSVGVPHPILKAFDGA